MWSCLLTINGILALSRYVDLFFFFDFFMLISRRVQAMILRDQKSWSGRSAIERLFWTTDNSIELVSRSTDWVARE
jgi:hypothetical protein